MSPLLQTKWSCRVEHSLVRRLFVAAAQHTHTCARLASAWHAGVARVTRFSTLGTTGNVACKCLLVNRYPSLKRGPPLSAGLLPFTALGRLALYLLGRFLTASRLAQLRIELPARLATHRMIPRRRGAERLVRVRPKRGWCVGAGRVVPRLRVHKIRVLNLRTRQLLQLRVIQWLGGHRSQPGWWANYRANSLPKRLGLGKRLRLRLTR